MDSQEWFDTMQGKQDLPISEMILRQGLSPSPLPTEREIDQFVFRPQHQNLLTSPMASEFLGGRGLFGVPWSMVSMIGLPALIGASIASRSTKKKKKRTKVI